MHCTVVAVKMLVMKHMEIVTTARPLKSLVILAKWCPKEYLEAIMSQPGPHGTVHYDPQSMDWMQPKSHRNKCCTIVQGRLNWVHVCTGEGSGVVGLVVKTMHLQKIVYFFSYSKHFLPVYKGIFQYLENWLFSMGALPGEWGGNEVLGSELAGGPLTGWGREHRTRL